MSGVDVETVRKALRPVQDPEIGFSIVDLGLIRGIEVEEGKEGSRVTVKMTMTSPMCPLAPEMLEAARYAVAKIPGVEHAAVELVWSPPWDPRVDASEEVRAELGIWD